VAGAYSDTDYMKVFENMRKGIQLSIKVLSLGFAPFCPWLDYNYPLFGLPSAEEIEKDISSLTDEMQKKMELGEITIGTLQHYSLSWLDVSDAVLVREEWENSNGTKNEIKRANELGIPVFFTIASLIEHFMTLEGKEVKEVEANVGDCAFDKFVELVRDQWEYGGKKYALSDSSARESTDELFDKHGKNWLFGTIDKYTFRFKNLARERDLLKISCYMYILWLKRGYFAGSASPSPIDTNIEIKAKYFGDFVDSYKKQSDMSEYDREGIEEISDVLGYLSHIEWGEIKERDLFSIFHISYNLWIERFADSEEHDTDTFNEEKNKKA
jgi:hypothetical protein